MKLERAMKLHAQLTQPQMYDLCRDYLDEQDILRAMNPPKINGKKLPGTIPELTLQAICRDAIPAYAVRRKIEARTIPIVV